MSEAKTKTAAAANAEFSAKIRTASHKVSLVPNTEQPVHPHFDNNGISTRYMQVTGLRPTHADLIALMVNEATAFTAEEFSQLLDSLNAIAPTPKLNS